MTAAIEVRALERVYGAGHTAVRALRGIDLSVPAGAWVGVKGRSGSGKTTLLNCIGGLDRPTRGSVHVFGTDIHALTPAELTAWRRTQVGFVFQAHALIPTLSAWENVELPLRLAGGAALRARRLRAEECLGTVGLAKWIDHRPGEMSGGQQQRVALARALACRPRLLLADEPTGDLDTATAREILAVLRRAALDDGITIIMSSHDQMALEHADQILELIDGQLA